MNALLDDSRDARLKIAVDGFCDTLRSPDALHRLIMINKPAGIALGDFALCSMLNELMNAHMVRRDYRSCQSLLGTLFGPWVPDGYELVPIGTAGASRGTNGTKAATR